MRTVTSKDGTRIAYDKIGEGPAVILVNGALAYRAYWGHGPLAAQLADHFTVYTYDRRGRGESGDAVALFMTLTGASAEDVDGARQSPVWSIFEAVAPTLAYDHSAILGDDASVPTGRAASVAVPTLVMDGGASYPFMHVTAVALAKAMPHGQHRTLEGQTHEVAPEVLAPVLVEFFNSNAALR